MKKLDKNTTCLFCCWNENAHYNVSRFCNFAAHLYFITTAFIAILLCLYMCVCVCACACALISFFRKGLLLSKLMSRANINAQISDIMLQTLADLLPQNFPHLRLYLQISEIPAKQLTQIKMIWSVWCRRSNEWMNIYWYKSDLSQPSTDTEL